MFLLQGLKALVTKEEVIRNFVYSINKYADFQRGIGGWNKFCEERPAVEPVVTVRWKHCEMYFTKYHTELESDPSTKKALNIANFVTAQVEQTTADTKVATQALVENAENIALLKARIAELEAK